MSRFRTLKCLPDKIAIILQYLYHFKKLPDLNHPKTFNEKLQWLKLNDRNPQYTKMVDKYEVRKYISDKIGEKYLIPLIGGPWDDTSEIDFSQLPNQFVLKCTHDSGSIVICRDKKNFDKKKLDELNRKLKKNFYYEGREWPYKNVRPRIIAEKYMEDSCTHELRDYKFFCFNGSVKYFKVDFNREVAHRANYYNVKQELMEFGEVICPPDFEKKINIPLDLNEMISLAEIIAKGTKFVRIDFYYANGLVYFGEITFFPMSGYGKFIPEEWDYILGEQLCVDE